MPYLLELQFKRCTIWNLYPAARAGCDSRGSLRSLRCIGKYAVCERVYQFLPGRVSQQTAMWNLLRWWKNYSRSLKSVILAPRDNDDVVIPQWQEIMFIISWIFKLFRTHSARSAQASWLHSASIPCFFLQSFLITQTISVFFLYP